LRPDIALGADIIAGFPTETEAMFDNSLRLVDEIGLTHLHVFPYSSRPDTPAARMPQLPGPVIRERASRLRAKGEQAMAAFRAARIGTVASVLVEQDNQGHCQHYLPVRLDRDAQAGSIQPVRILGVGDDHLIGTFAA
jgi:threonylcarbamoyladenosine tRNA methylthiotransferase MtaB